MRKTIAYCVYTQSNYNIGLDYETIEFIDLIVSKTP